MSAYQRAPEGPWTTTWLVVAGLVALVVLAAEGLLWAAGVQPSVTDGAELWARERALAASATPRDLVLAGSSRCQAAIDPTVLEAELPGRKVINLCKAGWSPFPSLEDLAEDDRVNSTVLVEFVPRRFFTHDGFSQELARKTIAREPSPEEPWHRRVFSHASLRLEGALRVMRSASYADAARALVQDRPSPDAAQAATMRRQKLLDFEGRDGAAIRRRQNEKVAERDAADGPFTADDWRQRLQRVRAWVDAIEARGGRVIFVRFNSSGPVLTGEQQRWPRSSHWERFLSNGFTGVHFADVPEMASIPCGDGGHINYRDAARFTRALAEVLSTLLPES